MPGIPKTRKSFRPARLTTLLNLAAIGASRRRADAACQVLRVRRPPQSSVGTGAPSGAHAHLLRTRTSGQPAATANL